MPKRLLKHFSRREKQTTFVAIGALRVNIIYFSFQLKEAPCDFREFDSSTQIKSLTADIIDKVSCLCSSDDIDIELEQLVLFLIYNFHMKTQFS